MKQVLVTLLALFTFGSTSFAQVNATCGATPGELETTMNSMALGGVAAPAFTTNPAGIANTEYVVTLQDTLADDSLGWEIVAADVDGSITPSVWQGGGFLNPGETFLITAVSYDLSQVQGLVDKILTTQIPDCCLLLGSQVPMFCENLNAAGYNSGSDVQDLNDVLAVFNLFSPGSISLEGFIGIMEAVNAQIATLAAVGCADASQNPLCYAIALPLAQASYTIDPVGVNDIYGTTFGVAQNTPNPFSTVTEITISTEKVDDLDFVVYNLIGNQVYNERLELNKGDNLFQFDGSNLTPGVYIYTVGNNEDLVTKRMVINR